nr:hypothetical protein Hi04_10k_c1889_00032 [uncultured bacterium]
MTVSVIIPAYNAVAFVGRAIESALRQSSAPLEVLVIDDGSTDETSSVVSRYPHPVRLFRQPNAGPGAARNRGARAASGEWLAMLDADDVWLPQKLERQLSHARGADADMVYSLLPRRRAPAVARFDALWNGNFIANSSAIVRRSIFWQVGGYDEDPELIGCEDWNLWLRMAAASGRLALLPEILHLKERVAGSLSQQTERMMRADLANVRRIGRLLQMPPHRLRAREAALREQYGRDFLYERNLRLARRQFGASLAYSPSLRRLGLWMAAALPLPALDYRRRVAREQAAPGHTASGCSLAVEGSREWQYARKP